MSIMDPVKRAFAPIILATGLAVSSGAMSADIGDGTVDKITGPIAFEPLKQADRLKRPKVEFKFQGPFKTKINKETYEKDLRASFFSGEIEPNTVDVLAIGTRDNHRWNRFFYEQVFAMASRVSWSYKDEEASVDKVIGAVRSNKYVMEDNDEIKLDENGKKMIEISTLPGEIYIYINDWDYIKYAPDNVADPKSLKENILEARKFLFGLFNGGNYNLMSEQMIEKYGSTKNSVATDGGAGDDTSSSGTAESEAIPPIVMTFD